MMHVRVAQNMTILSKYLQISFSLIFSKRISDLKTSNTSYRCRSMKYNSLTSNYRTACRRCVQQFLIESLIAVSLQTVS